MAHKYAVHNTVRSVHTRTKRAKAPVHHGLKQYIGGEHRVLRGRPILLTEEKFQALLPELKEKAEQGLIEVKTLDGRKMDLSTFEAEPVPVTPPMPHPPLDSIENDKPWGEKRPQFVGGDVESDPHKVPDLVANAPRTETTETGKEPEVLEEEVVEDTGLEKLGDDEEDEEVPF